MRLSDTTLEALRTRAASCVVRQDHVPMTEAQAESLEAQTGILTGKNTGEVFGVFSLTWLHATPSRERKEALLEDLGAVLKDHYEESDTRQLDRVLDRILRKIEYGERLSFTDSYSVTPGEFPGPLKGGTRTRITMQQAMGWAPSQKTEHRKERLLNSYERGRIYAAVDRARSKGQYYHAGTADLHQARTADGDKKHKKKMRDLKADLMRELNDKVATFCKGGCHINTRDATFAVVHHDDRATASAAAGPPPPSVVDLPKIDDLPVVDIPVAAGPPASSAVGKHWTPCKPDCVAWVYRCRKSPPESSRNLVGLGARLQSPPPRHSAVGQQWPAGFGLAMEAGRETSIPPPLPPYGQEVAASPLPIAAPDPGSRRRIPEQVLDTFSGLGSQPVPPVYAGNRRIWGHTPALWEIYASS